METLKAQLIREQLTCIVRVHDQLYPSQEAGIRPLLHFIEQGVLQDAVLCDKVVGKAAVMLMIYGGVTHIHALTISSHALAFAANYPVAITYDKVVPYIINRKKDGMCPMEHAVLDCEDLQEAYQILLKKSEEMKRSQNR